jgi:hypothetical protein
MLCHPGQLMARMPVLQPMLMKAAPLLPLALPTQPRQLHSLVWVWVEV